MKMNDLEVSNRRYVELDGKTPELERLKDFLTQYDDYKIIKPDGSDKYYLTATRFETLSADALLKDAKDMIPRLAGFAEVKDHVDCRSVKIGEKIIGKNMRNFLLNVVGVEAEASEVPPTLTIGGRVVSTTQHKGKLDDLISDENKQDALDYFAKERTLVNLNKVYETVKIAVDGDMKVTRSKIVKNGWATKSKLIAFTDAANIYDDINGTVSEARHARLYVEWWQKQPDHSKDAQRQKQQKANKSQMTPYEAEQLIKRILNGWIN